MPLAGEERFIASCLEHGGQRPFSGGQSTSLPLESHGRHAAAIWDAAGLHGGAAGCAARLRVEVEERHALLRHALQVWCRHAAARTSAVRTGVAVAEIVG